MSCVWVYPCRPEVLESLELELQVFESHLKRVLEIELGPSVRVIHALNP